MISACNPFGGRNGRRSLAAVMFREFATRGRVSGRDILKVVLSQNLVDILFLVYFMSPGFCSTCMPKYQEHWPSSVIRKVSPI